MSHREIAKVTEVLICCQLWRGPVRGLGTEIPSGVEGHINQTHEQNSAAIKETEMQ